MIPEKRAPLPPGYTRDPNNPGLIKLTGEQAASENQYVREIRRLEERVRQLEEEVRSINNKLNKSVVENENV